MSRARKRRAKRRQREAGISVLPFWVVSIAVHALALWGISAISWQSPADRDTSPTVRLHAMEWSGDEAWGAGDAPVADVEGADDLLVLPTDPRDALHPLPLPPGDPVIAPPRISPLPPSQNIDVRRQDPALDIFESPTD